MATNQKILPCPRCGSSDLTVYEYEHGWRHVECNEGFNRPGHLCGYLGPGEGSVRQAIKAHNDTIRSQKEAGTSTEI